MSWLVGSFRKGFHSTLGRSIDSVFFVLFFLIKEKKKEIFVFDLGSLTMMKYMIP